MGLVYGIDRQLRDGDRLLAGFDEDSLTGCIVVDHRRYEIARHERHGWHFRLVDFDAGQDACEYVPYRVGRGGRILGGLAPVTLRGVALRPRRWTFASEAGWRVDAKVVARAGEESRLFPLRVIVKLLRAPGDIWRALSRWGGDRSVPAEVQVESRRRLSSFEVRLEGVDPVIVSPDLSLLLAFGCWIVIEWQSMSLPGGGG